MITLQWTDSMHTCITGAKSKHQRLKLCFKEFDMLKILQLCTTMERTFEKYWFIATNVSAHGY